jgi:hypothetical protein
MSRRRSPLSKATVNALQQQVPVGYLKRIEEEDVRRARLEQEPYHGALTGRYRTSYLDQREQLWQQLMARVRALVAVDAEAMLGSRHERWLTPIGEALRVVWMQDLEDRLHQIENNLLRRQREEAARTRPKQRGARH